MLLQPLSALALSTAVVSLSLPIALAAPAPFPDSVHITSIHSDDGNTHNLNKEKRTWIWEEPGGDNLAKRTWGRTASPGHEAAANTEDKGGGSKKKRTWPWDGPGGGDGTVDVASKGHEWARKRGTEWAKKGGGGGGGNGKKRDDGLDVPDGHIAADGFITVDKRGTTSV